MRLSALLKARTRSGLGQTGTTAFPTPSKPAPSQPPARQKINTVAFPQHARNPALRRNSLPRLLLRPPPAGHARVAHRLPLHPRGSVSSLVFRARCSSAAIVSAKRRDSRVGLAGHGNPFWRSGRRAVRRTGVASHQRRLDQSRQFRRRRAQRAKTTAGCGTSHTSRHLDGLFAALKRAVPIAFRTATNCDRYDATGHSPPLALKVIRRAGWASCIAIVPVRFATSCRPRKADCAYLPFSPR